MAWWYLGIGCILAWYGLPFGCSYIPTGLVLQLSSVLSKSNSYLLSTSWRIKCSSSDKCLLSDVHYAGQSFCSDNLRYNVYAVWSPKRVNYTRFIHSKIFFYEPNRWKIESFFQESFIEAVHYSYKTQYTLILLLEKHKYIFYSDNMSHPSIMWYLWQPWESSTWNFHVTLFLHLSQIVRFILYLYIYYWSHLLVCPNETAWYFSFEIFVYVYPVFFRSFLWNLVES